jgi:FAD synthetase
VSYDQQSALSYNHHASILPICTGLARRITIFLNNEADTPLLKAVQDQTKTSLGVIDAALERYRYFAPLVSPSRSLTCAIS